jgi:hypothetical protein
MDAVLDSCLSGFDFVTGPNAWQAQPNQSTAAFIIDNNPNIQNAVNGVYGPNNGAPTMQTPKPRM